MISAFHRRDIRCEKAEIIARLQPDRWSEWATGISVQWARPAGDGMMNVRVGAALPRPFELTLVATVHDNGLELELLEGDVTALTGSVLLVGDHVEATLRLDVPVVVPPSLSRELSTQVLPSWVQGLVG